MLERLDCLCEFRVWFPYSWQLVPHVTIAMPSISNASVTTLRSLSSPASFCRAHIDLESQDPIGIRTVPDLIEYNAVHNPDYLFCLQAQKQAQETGPQLQPVSHLQLKRAIRQCQASLLDSIKGLKSPSTNDDGTVSRGPLVALYLESDVGLLIYLYALLGLGVPVRLPYFHLMGSVGLSIAGAFALRTVESYGHSAPISCH